MLYHWSTYHKKRRYVDLLLWVLICFSFDFSIWVTHSNLLKRLWTKVADMRREVPTTKFMVCHASSIKYLVQVMNHQMLSFKWSWTKGHIYIGRYCTSWEKGKTFIGPNFYINSVCHYGKGKRLKSFFIPKKKTNEKKEIEFC